MTKDQSSLQKRLSEEINDYAWEFEANRIAKMLSAAGNLPSDPLVSSAHSTLERRVQFCWPTLGSRRVWYAPVAIFLNNCVEVCHSALDSSRGSAERSCRWYNGLKFIVYDNPTVDKIEGAPNLKPDLVGGLGINPDERFAWNPTDPYTNQILLPVEVGKDWASVVIQAAKCARCLFDVDPSRQFALVLGFGHIKAELRFLVFHRSGLTASKPLSFKDEQGQKDILRIFLSILGWESANDAGFLEFHDGVEMCLLRHKDDVTGTVARVAEVLQDELGVRGRGSKIFFVRYPGYEGKEPEPPIPTIWARRRTESESRTKRGEPYSTDFLHKPHVISVKCPSPSTLIWPSALDTDSDANGHHTHAIVKHSWREESYRKVEADLLTKCKGDFGTPDYHYSFCPTDAHGNPMSTARFLPSGDEQPEEFHWRIINTSQVPSDPQHRRLWIHVTNLAGRSLLHAKTPWELCVAIGHALLGWLSMLQKGFLHRNINIYNTLLLDTPVTMRPFDARSIGQLTLQNGPGDQFNEHVERLEDCIRKLGFSDKCNGFVIDDGVVASLEKDSPLHGPVEKFGAYEFMSGSMLHRLRYQLPYHHSPVDDLWSFYYTVQWAVAFNDGANGGKHNEMGLQEFQEMLSHNYRRETAIFMAPCGAKYGPFFTHSLGLLTTWKDKLHDLTTEGEPYKGNWRSNFLLCSYRGVAEYLELVHGHRALLQQEV